MIYERFSGPSRVKAVFYAVAATLVAAAAFFVYRNAADALVVLDRADLRMNTLATISVEAPRKTAEEALEASFSLLEALDDALSRYKKGSDVSNVNESSGGSPVRVSADTAALLRAALEIAEKTGGCFDPTVGPLTDLWRILPREGEEWVFPSEKQAAAARGLVDYRGLSVDHPFVRLRAKGAALDLGGIAKGYAADKVAELCKARGVRSALLDLGGNLLILGTRSREAPWRLGIRHPLKDKNSILCSLEFDLAPGETMSLATSGSYERFREVGGKRLSHVFDPRTGLPVETSLLSVSVIDPCSARADALATAFLVMGEEKAREALSGFPATDAVFVRLEDNGEITASLTRGLRKHLKFTDSATAFAIY
ncbi:MAG: FAD:protein FMN transferase [Synergistaceae bacterium]|jgi:thiamine biosynthesis lipoprotein|nr:FAD:protein FMN transferase [Synergistaceae bacterium]